MFRVQETEIQETITLGAHNLLLINFRTKKQCGLCAETQWIPVNWVYHVH